MARKGEPVLEVPKRKAGWPVKPADLARNTETLAEHRRRLAQSAGKVSPLTPEEEARLFPGDKGYV